MEGRTWRDRAGVNGPLMRAGFPSAPIELRDAWEDLITVNQTFTFERALIVSRRAAHRRCVSATLSDDLRLKNSLFLFFLVRRKSMELRMVQDDLEYDARISAQEILGATPPTSREEYAWLPS